MIIRAYEPRDRAAVRHICCETADAGRPVEAFCSDRELIADLVTRYYTDHDPGCSWVVEHEREQEDEDEDEDDGEQEREVVGYLTGCLDTARQQRWVAWRVAPLALGRRLGRRATWRLIVAGWRSRPPARPWLREYPASVHVNLLPSARRGGLGGELLDRFLAQARGAGRPGLHASTRADNPGAGRFFERHGFGVVARWAQWLPQAGGWLRTENVIYAKEL